MNILYLEHYAGSREMGMEFRPYYLSREWVRMGHRVTIVAGDYSHLRKSNPEVRQDFQTEEIDGIEYVWLKTGRYSGNGAKRALTMERFVRKLMTRAGWIARKWKPDLVIASSTYPLDTWPAARIARKAGAKYVHEVHDLWPSTLYEMGGMSRKHPFVVLMQIGENSAYRHCDACVSLMPYTLEYMKEHGLREDKWINIQNGVVEEEWTGYESIPQQHRDFFEEHRGQFIVGYFGAHSLSNALDLSLDTAKEMMNRPEGKDIIFVFVGEGVEKERLVRRAKDEEISNAFFLPRVNKAAVPDLLRSFDCVYMNGMPSPLYRFGLCLNKMYDTMMAGVPVLCVFDAPDTLVRQYDCGFQCSPENREDVISAILKLKAMTPEERHAMGERGREAVVREYTYQRLAERFLKETMGDTAG